MSKLLMDQFDERIAGLVNSERMKDYGHPLEHFNKSSAMKAQIAGCPDLALKHALEMILDKVARLSHSPEHFDSWLDIAGYARTACMVIDKRNAHKDFKQTKLDKLHEQHTVFLDEASAITPEMWYKIMREKD